MVSDGTQDLLDSFIENLRNFNSTGVLFEFSSRGSMFVVLLLGIYGRRINAFFADVAMILTLGVGLFWVIWKTYRGSYPLSPYLTDTYACIIVAFLVTAIGSLFSPRKTAFPC